MPITDTYHTENVSFRFVDFPAKLLPRLSDSLPGVEVKTKEHNDERGLVVWLRSDGNGTCDAHCAFIREQQIPSAKYGLWISLITSRDNDGIRVPQFAIELLRKIGGQLDFSFISG